MHLTFLSKQIAAIIPEIKLIKSLMTNVKSTQKYKLELYNFTSLKSE